MKRTGRWRWLVLVAIVGAFGPAACAGKPKPPPPVTPIAGCVDDDEQRTNGITLTRTDGATVDALSYGTGDSGIVFANQVDGDLCQWQFYAQLLAKKGFRTIVFNYSNYSADNDVLAGVVALRAKGAKRVYLIGASKGGTDVLAAAAEASPPVNGVISLSGPRGFGGVSADAVMPTFATPVLFIVGEYDTDFAADAKALYAACAEKDKQLVIRPSGNHGVELVDSDVLDLMQRFIAGH